MANDLGARPTARQLRSQLGAAERWRDPNDPEIVRLRGELRTTVAADYITRLVADWPPLTTEQRAHLAALALTAPDGEAA